MVSMIMMIIMLDDHDSHYVALHKQPQATINPSNTTAAITTTTVLQFRSLKKAVEVSAVPPP